jgi:flagellar M-ring protein FliF
MVSPTARTRTVGILLGYGLPHRALNGPKAAEGMSPKTTEEKRQDAIFALENDLVDQIRQFEVVADAYVKIVPSDEDALPSERKPAKASVQLALKPGANPNKTQIEAILNLVAFSVPGLQPENVKITDRLGHVWNDGLKIAAINSGSGAGEEAFENENLAIKKAYEKRFQDKIQMALNNVLGQNNYTVTVDADIDFTQTKIETTNVGEPGGDNKVIEGKEIDSESYNNQPKDKDAKAKPGNQQVGMPMGGDKDAGTSYAKSKTKVKIKYGQTVKTAIIAPGVVKKITTTIAVNGKRDEAEKAKLAEIAAGAIGLDASRGDQVKVVDLAFVPPTTATAETDLAPPGYFEGTNRPKQAAPVNTAYIIAAMAVPMVLALGVVGVFLLKQRKVQADKTGIILGSGPGANSSDISDLLSDKVGRSTVVSQTTKVNNTEQLEKLAKEKPTKVAELLKSTWLSDRER